ncbi:MAG: hypothetical protein ACAH80_17735 [Alphaproteobacteria bacterium]
MSDNEHKNSNSWFKAATICTAFACVAAVSSVAETQSTPDVARAAAFGKNEHRRLLERKIDLNVALATLGGSSQDALTKYRTEATARLDAESTGDPVAMLNVISDNRKLEQNILQMNKALSVSRA